MTRHLISFDWALKHILRDKANFAILEGFLSELLKYDVTILEILESESNQSDASTKFNRVDLLVKNDKQELILIELQYQRQLDYFQRILFGASRLISEHLAVGTPYEEIKKVIAIHIIYFDLGQGEDYLYHGTTRFLGVHQHDELQLSTAQQEAFRKEKIADLFPEYYLIKVEKFNDLIQDRFDEWVYFLKHEEIKDEFQAKSIHLAKEKLNILKLPEPERQAYEAWAEDLHYQASMFWSSHTEGYQEGKQEGLEEGERKGKQLGLQEGELKGKQQMLLSIAQAKFGILPPAVITQIEAIREPAQLEQRVSGVITAESLDDFVNVMGQQP